MEQGWIKLHRKLTDWEWYTDIPTCRVFVHLMLVCNYATASWRGISVKKGQYLTTLSGLAHDTGLSNMQIRRALKNLRDSGTIRTTVTRKKTLITICKYESYQAFEKSPQHDNNTKKNTNSTRKKPLSDTPSDTPTSTPTDSPYIIYNKKIRREEGKNSNTLIEKSARATSTLDAPEKKSLGGNTEGVEGVEAVAELPTKQEQSERAREALQIAERVQVFYNKAADGCNLPKCTKLTPRRIEAVNARVRENGIEAVEQVLQRAARSQFLNGLKTDFRASFDWLFAPNNFMKVAEGNYDDLPTKQSSSYGHTRKLPDDVTDEQREQRFREYVLTKLSKPDDEADFGIEEIS